ncbi:MAG TPA: hypothetical protein VEH04_08340 [Verrucomicrobiae bacterium]|nr:hypothetical protein [Verrucomicrobiae bacterium]
MAPRRVPDASLRPDQPEFSRLFWALLISIVVHALAFGGYKAGQRYGLWNVARLPQWMQRVITAAAVEPPKQPEAREVPLMFVDVNPQLATAEPPKDAQFYSNANSQAANREADQEAAVPKITGTQTDMVKAEDVERSPLDRLQPNIQRAATEQEPEQARRSTPIQQGDIAIARPEAELRDSDGTAERARPRTVREAMLRQNRNQLAGQRMKQEGGVRRHTDFTSLDAKQTSFGDYDAAFIAAVESRWFALLENNPTLNYRNGRVVLRFRLSYDGRITAMEVVENNVGETLGLICQKAILDPAPFERWPREMRLMMQKEFREIQFAFYYY